MRKRIRDLVNGIATRLESRGYILGSEKLKRWNSLSVSAWVRVSEATLSNYDKRRGMAAEVEDDVVGDSKGERQAF